MGLWANRGFCESGSIDPLAGPGYIGVYAKRAFEIPIPQKAEIDKWWPLIKAANIKVE